MPKITLVPVEPAGMRPSRAIMCGPNGCGIGEILMREYPASHVEAGEKYREFRVGKDERGWMSLGDAARVTGLSPAQISDIEHGRACFSNDASRELYLAALAEEHLRRAERAHA